MGTHKNYSGREKADSATHTREDVGFRTPPGAERGGCLRLSPRLLLGGNRHEIG